jgi:hypothetical protein
MAEENEVIFRDRDGKPQLWIRRYRGKTTVNTRMESFPGETKEEIIDAIRKYLAATIQPSFDAALYHMAVRGKLSTKYTNRPIFTLIGDPGNVNLLVFPDLSIYDGNEFYESVNELCIELRYNPSYRKRLRTVTPLEPVSKYASVMTEMATAIRRLKQVNIKLP